ncbi:MAG: hypothetical protein ORN83_03385, partial [Chthoniobacteraceae bacterium]|nr:hypothetical protein [Chthoniobacteraceae bacterium]
MNRVLSLLLLVPFLITQVLTVAPAFARGGPFDDLLSKSASALAGTYGVALTGVGDTTNDYQWQKSTKDPNNVTDVPNKGEVPTNASHLPASNVTGVMAMSLPATGMATGRVLLFKEGLMYVGTAQGVLDSRSGKIRLLSQLTHYFLRIGTDGVQGATNLETIDSMYTGQINLNLAIDYFSGLIEATGDARFSEYNPFMSSTTTSVLPIATSVTTQG